MKLNDVYERWAAYHKREVKESTMSTYQVCWVKRIAPLMGDMEVEELKRQQMQQFIDTMLDRGNSPKYVKDCVLLLKMVARYAAEELELAVVTQWKLRYPAHRGKERPVTYTAAEWSKIVRTCKDNPSPLALGILLTLCTGMRIGEICALRFSDIDLKAKTITVQRTIERVYQQQEDGTFATKIIIGTPKTSTSRRVIPIMADIMPMVRNFAKCASPDYYVCTMSEQPTEPRVWRSRYSWFISHKCGLRVIKYHGLRHTFATLMIEGKTDVKTVASLLGHSDVSTTLNTYVHPSEESKRKSIDGTLRRLLK